MKANEFLNEGIVDKLKGAAKKISLPKMKVKKTDPRTAIAGRKTGGSPEFKAAKAALAPMQSAPQPSQPVAAPVKPNPAASYTDIKTSIDQQMYEKRIAKAIVSNIQDINSPELLNSIKIAIDAKLGTSAN